MGLQGVFHQFVLASDYVAAANGASSAAFVAGSDIGNLLFALDSDRQYFITDIDVGLHTVSNEVTFVIGTLDSDGAAGVFTPVHSGVQAASGAALAGDQDVHITRGTPIKVRYSDSANFLGVRLSPTDSDTVINGGYSGFSLPS